MKSEDMIVVQSSREVVNTVALTLVVLAGAFVYKVWNERQMTREYARIADELRGIHESCRP